MSEAQIERPAESRAIRTVKIFGERNTGSGYLERLLTRNLRVDCLRGGFPKPLRRLFPESEHARDLFFRATRRRNLGWKHAMAPDRSELQAARLDPSRILFLTLTKNPYAWLVSLYRRPYHAKHAYPSFSEFLSLPWKTVDREHAQPQFANPIEMWNQKNASYLALRKYATSRICRYEDLLEDPFDFLEKICAEHDLSRLRPSFENVQAATKGDDRAKTFDDYRDYYLNERWRSELDEPGIRLINESLDEELMSRLHYARLDPKSGTPAR